VDGVRGGRGEGVENLAAKVASSVDIAGAKAEPPGGGGTAGNVARAGAGMILAVEVREHDFMREERHPLKCSRPISVGATKEFMLAVGQPDEFGVAELADDLFAITFGNEVL
jgi:hypothetical protein